MTCIKTWKLGYSNLVNTKIAESIKYQPHGGYNCLLSARNAIKVNLEGLSLIE